VSDEGDSEGRMPWKYEQKTHEQSESIWTKPLFKSKEPATESLFQTKAPKVITAADYYAKKTYYLLFGVQVGLALIFISILIKGH
jgi:hypothetical protein